jgi:hypothetical protein
MQVILVIIALVVAACAGHRAGGGANVAPALALFAAFVSILLAFLSPKTGLTVLVFAMLLSPEISLAGLSGTSRNVVIRYDDIILIVLFLSWFAKTAILKNKPLVFRSPVQTPILLYTLVCVLSTAFAVMGGKVRWEVSIFYVLKYIEYFLLYFMTFNIIEDKEDVRRYLKYGAIVAAIVTVYAVWYYMSAGAGARATTPFEVPLGKPEESEPASLGGYYILVFGLIFGVISEMPVRTFAWSFAAMVAMMPAFVFTLSRSSYIGLAFSAAAAVLLSKKRKLFLIGALLVGVGALVLTPSLSEKARERVEITYAGVYATNTFQTPFGEIRLEESAAMRVRSWQRSVFYWLPKNILIGNGVTGTGLVDAQLPLVIGETGVIGFLLWIWMIYVCFKVAWRLYRGSQEPFVRSIALGYIIGLIGLLFQSTGVNTFIIVRIMEPFWFLTAVVMKMAQMQEPAAKSSS